MVGNTKSIHNSRKIKCLSAINGNFLYKGTPEIKSEHILVKSIITPVKFCFSSLNCILNSYLLPCIPQTYIYGSKSQNLDLGSFPFGSLLIWASHQTKHWSFVNLSYFLPLHDTAPSFWIIASSYMVSMVDSIASSTKMLHETKHFTKAFFSEMNYSSVHTSIYLIVS